MSDKLTKIPEQDHGFIAIVERAIATPDLDVSKLMALLEFKKEWEAAEAKKAERAATAAEPFQSTQLPEWTPKEIMEQEG